MGSGLLALGVVVGVLILMWLLVNLAGGQLRAGGFVFGLILLALLAVPLAGAGWYLRRQGAVEAADTERFAARQAVLDTDRAVRRELARELEQGAAGLLGAADTLPGSDATPVRVAARRLQDLAEDVSRPGYDAATWLERADATSPPDLDTIRRYDDLVLEEARRLETLQRALASGGDAPRRLADSVDALAAHVREREALFGRGRRAPGMSPQELLAAGAAPRRRLETPLALRLDDAVTHETADYLVRAVLTYFAGGREWRTYQLHDGRQERWLEVRSGGTETTWYEARPVPGALAADVVRIDGAEFHPTESGTASVDIESAAGRQEGVFVEYRRHVSGPGDRLLAERWPDGPRTLIGRPVAPGDLRLWTKPPAAE